ncbi:MAG: energy transducer TonB [Acidobacteriia bacterium]|nr:energy transducer TonB [Terriglobia bacterium]
MSVEPVGEGVAETSLPQAYPIPVEELREGPDVPRESRRRSLASGYWGDIPPSDQRLRRPTREEADEIVLRGLLDMSAGQEHRNPREWAVSLLVHVAVVAVVVVAPLLFTQVIDRHAFQATFIVPRPPAAPVPAPPAMKVLKNVPRAIVPTHFMAPAAIPARTMMVKAEAPDIAAAGVADGIPGGETDGALGGLLGGTGISVPSPVAPTHAVKKTVYRLGGNLKPPRQILYVEPKYPIIAKRARTEGIVVVDAVIDENGNVVKESVVSGPGLLVGPALEAVAQWKYEPTSLNGEPISLAMQVQVSFTLR